MLNLKLVDMQCKSSNKMLWNIFINAFQYQNVYLSHAGLQTKRERIIRGVLDT